nr:sugar transferase [Chloroflexota bacterium]
MSLAQPLVTRRRRLYALTKRAFDLFSAALLLLLLLPLMCVIALVIKATSPGPSILVQERVGKGGKVFAFYKFRSMYNNSNNSEDERYARDYINGNHRVAAPRGGVFKPANDHRITPVGRLLRKTSLDELPQLFNVLKGDMSLVGPRPSMPYEVDVYKPWHFRRLEVLPGITGLAQIKGRSSLTFKEIVSIDIEYIERRSLRLDLEILLKTLPVVLSGRGAR